MTKLEKFKLWEAPQKGEIVFTFGRFNPPTTGHEKLIDKVKKVSGSSDYKIFPSFSQNQKKDPLPHTLKIAYMRKMFPKHARNIIADKKAITAMDIAVLLHGQGYTELTMVVGSDRVREFETLLKKYNGVKGKRHGFYNFKNIKVVSAGDRDPDSEGVSGMSASKMRQAAIDSNMKDFESGLPKGFRDGKKLYRDVRKHMNIREEKNMGVMDQYEYLRDQYLTGKIWNIGDIVETNNVSGKIITRGTNYISFADSKNKVHKAWLHDIKESQKQISKDEKEDLPVEGKFSKFAKMYDFKNKDWEKWVTYNSKKNEQHRKEIDKIKDEAFSWPNEYAKHTKKVTPGEDKDNKKYKKVEMAQVTEWYESEEIRDLYKLRYGGEWESKLNETFNLMKEKVGKVDTNHSDGVTRVKSFSGKSLIKVDKNKRITDTQSEPEESMKKKIFDFIKKECK